MKRNIFYCIALAVFCTSFSFIGKSDANLLKTIVIDPGHGGFDPGTVGKHLKEKDVALDVSLRLKKILEKQLPEVKVIMTRSKDIYVERKLRGKIAINNMGDLFVSIHCNAALDRSRVGTETYVLGINKGQERYDRIIERNEAMLFKKSHKEVYGGFEPGSPEAIIYFQLLKNSYRNESLRVADLVEKSFFRSMRRYSAGVKQAPFEVLYYCGMPAILTEIGFISNHEEEQFLSKGSSRDQVAQSIFEALKSYKEELEKM